jgi:hypothetical protein
MDNRSKNYLRKLIRESQISDIDEMAWKQQDKRDKYHDPKRPIRRSIPAFSDTNPYEEIGKYKGDPEGWIINPTKTSGADQLVLYYFDCHELEEIKNKYKDIIEEFEERYGLTATFYPCKPTARERSSITEPSLKLYRDGGNLPGMRRKGDDIKSTSIEEKIRRDLYKILQVEVEEKLKETFETYSIPLPSFQYNRQRLDKHSDEATNEEIYIATHAVKFFNTLDEFIDAITNSLTGEISPNNDELQLRKLRIKRIYPTIYKKWNIDRQQGNIYKGQTDKYDLPTLGYSEDKNEVGIYNFMSISGKLINGVYYTWKIKIEMMIGKMVGNDKNSLDVLVPEMTFTDSVSVDDTTYSDSIGGTVINDESIVDSLKKCIEKLKGGIESIDLTEKLLNYAYKEEGDQINERYLNKLTKSILSEIKNKF